MTQSEALKILQMGYNAFLTGAAGTGKSYLINSFIRFLKSHKIVHAVTASTGIAATHISGMTIHAWSGLGIAENLDEQDIDRLIQKEHIYKRWRDVEVLIIDEVSMLHGSQLDSLDRLGRAMKQKDAPFGGVQVVLIGDFFQLPPVQKDRDKQQAFAFEHPVWKRLNLAVLYLTEQFRQDDDKLLRILTEIRAGKVTTKSKSLLEDRTVEYIEEDAVTKLFTHNMNVDEYNRWKLEELAGESYTYQMVTRGSKPLLESLKKASIVDEVVYIKEGARVMCTKNNFEKGYVNGSVGYVVGEEDGNPVIQLLSGKEVVVAPEVWRIEENGKVLAEISQVPLRLAWAITVHKSQGMSLDQAVIDLRASFTHGQGYVALSRLRTLEGLTLMGFNDTALLIDERVKRFDLQLQEVSQKTARRLEDLGEAIVEARIEKSIEEKGGVQEEVDVESLVETKQSTYDKTLILIHEKLTLDEIARKRSFTKETALAHVEHLLLKHPKLDIEYMRPDGPRMKKLISKWSEVDSNSLSEMMEATHHEYSYEELRIARLFRGGPGVQ
jgi:hypothetical protein